jgi:hypothetical protein
MNETDKLVTGLEKLANDNHWLIGSIQKFRKKLSASNKALGTSFTTLHFFITYKCVYNKLESYIT